MSGNSKVIYSFLAGAALGIIAASLISKEDREKMAAKLKEKISRTRDKLSDELDDLNAQLNKEKTT